jgi:hypothetical protein
MNTDSSIKLVTNTSPVRPDCDINYSTFISVIDTFAVCDKLLFRFLTRQLDQELEKRNINLVSLTHQYITFVCSP